MKEDSFASECNWFNVLSLNICGPFLNLSLGSRNHACSSLFTSQVDNDIHEHLSESEMSVTLQANLLLLHQNRLTSIGFIIS